MYKINDKRRLYWLIEQYLSGKINETKFCDEFYYSYDLEIRGSDNSLSELEKEAFEELRKVSNRFSPYEEDHKLDPSGKAFSTLTQLKQAILSTREKLSLYFSAQLDQFN